MIITGIFNTILIIIAVVAFIASLKATVIISYSDEVRLSVKVLFLKIKILPAKEKKPAPMMSAKKAEKIRTKLRQKAEKKRIASEEKARKKEEKKATKEKKSIGEIISDVHMLTGVATTVIKKFFKHLRIRLAKIRITVATGDAAMTAIAYGAITQSLNILLPALESVKNFEKLKSADINVGIDYTADSPLVDVKLMFSIRVWHVFDLAFAALLKFISHKLKSDAKKHDPPKKAISNPTPKSNKI